MKKNFQFPFLNFHFQVEKGFTLIELLLIIGLTSVLLGIVTINLLKVQHNTSVSASANSFIADIKSQQNKAMSGVLASSNGNYGVYFDPTTPNKYVLFHGTSYNPADTTNFTVTLDSPMTVSTTFPGNNVIFSGLSGEVCASTCSYTITLTNSAGGEQKKLTFNRYGVIANIE